MSSEWTTVSIESVCELIVDCVNKTAPVVAEKTPYRMIRTTNVRHGRIDLGVCRYVDQKTFETWTRRATLQVGDVVLTREAPIGEGGRVTDAAGVFLGQRLMQYRSNPKLLDSRFLLYSFLSPELQNQFGSHEGSGSVVSHIRVGDCFKFKLRLPPMRAQREIAETLGAIDDRIALLRETNATLEGIAQALFKSWFVDFLPVKDKSENRSPEGMDEATALLFPNGFQESEWGSIPIGWKATPLGEMVELTKGCSYKGEGLSEETGAYMFNLGCFNAHRVFATEKVKRYTGDYKPRHSVGTGDLIIANTDMTQDRDILGRPLFIPDGFSPAFISHHVFKVTAKSSDPKIGFAIRLFLFFTLQRDSFRERAIGYATGTTVLGLPAMAVTGCYVIAPPDNVLEAFAKTVQPLWEQIQLNEGRSKDLSALRETLLPRLISGQLRIPEAAEELMALAA